MEQVNTFQWIRGPHFGTVEDVRFRANGIVHFMSGKNVPESNLYELMAEVTEMSPPFEMEDEATRQIAEMAKSEDISHLLVEAPKQSQKVANETTIQPPSPESVPVVQLDSNPKKQSIVAEILSRGKNQQQRFLQLPFTIPVLSDKSMDFLLEIVDETEIEQELQAIIKQELTEAMKDLIEDIQSGDSFIESMRLKELTNLQTFTPDGNSETE